MAYKIVIVDDEKVITETLKEELEEMTDDLDVQVYNLGWDALKAVYNGGIDLLISDISMPDLDGYNLYVKAKESKQDLPIIMMTGFMYDPKHVLVNIQQFGRVDVLLKPFRTEKLIRLIRKKLGNK